MSQIKANPNTLTSIRAYQNPIKTWKKNTQIPKMVQPPDRSQQNPSKPQQTLTKSHTNLNKSHQNPQNGEGSQKALSSNFFQQFLLKLMPATPFLLRVGMLLSLISNAFFRNKSVGGTHWFIHPKNKNRQISINSYQEPTHVPRYLLRFLGVSIGFSQVKI